MTTLAEPVVLAAAKETLYPETAEQPEQYAVTETQFTVDEWGDWRISEGVRQRLAPFNSIQLSSGQPDLIGVGLPAVEVLNHEAAGTPVIAVEAKGSNTDPSSADITRGIEQAHARLSDVNLGYVAAPMASVGETARALARDLNIGILGVCEDDSVEAVEPARVTGAGEFSTGVEAIRFQASTHQYTEGSFPVNHPKNYLGYALAHAAERETNEAYRDHVIREISGGRRGAILLGLIEERADGEYLTQLGAEVVRFALTHYDSIDSTLNTFEQWAGRRTRFTEYAPRWAQLARSVAIQYEPTALIVDALESLHRDGVDKPGLPTLARRVCHLNQPLGVEVFFTRDARDAVLTPEGEIDESCLDDPAVYKSGLYFQFKAQLYHVGLLKSVGTDDAEAAVRGTWELAEPVGSVARL